MPEHDYGQIKSWWQRRRKRLTSVIYLSLIIAALIIPLLLFVLPDNWKQNWKLLGIILTIVAATGGNLLANVIQQWRDGHTPATLLEARQRYLVGLRTACQVLPLAALGGDEGLDETLTLNEVYIDLETTTPASQNDTEDAAQADERYRVITRGEGKRWLTAQDAVAQAPRLVLLGDPGAGKSTFVRQLVADMATAHLGQVSMTRNLPNDLLPVFITLRALASQIDTLELSRSSEANRHSRLARAMHDQAIADLTQWGAETFAGGLRETLEAGRCFLVLDGLDEVPEHLRDLVREAVRAVIGMYHIPRVVVTCRSRSYTGKAVLPDFQAHRLAAFNTDKIKAFVEAWYKAQHTLGRFTAKEAKHKAEDLAHCALQPELQELANNPMLLTTMAIIHQRNIGLPTERVRLYNHAVDVLLRRWEHYRHGDDGMTPDTDLAAVLHDDLRLRSVMEALAYEAHCIQQGGRTAEDLPRGIALTLIDQPAYLRSTGLAQKFLDYVDQRAGLLVGQGSEPGKPGSYRFPHRTFQEYLAACHLVGQRDPIRQLFAHADDGDYWGQVVQLGAEELRYNVRRPYEMLNLAYNLCPSDKPSTLSEQRAALWSGTIALLAGQEFIVQDEPIGPVYLERLPQALVVCLRGRLTASERAEAGMLLARFGDPRFQPDRWHLPKDSLLGFVEIPEGSFTIGSEDPADSVFRTASPAHPLQLPTYYMARYPVTVMQFQAFVNASQHQPLDEECLLGMPNHPVVWVSWLDTMAYCDWLTNQLRAQLEALPAPLAEVLSQPGGRVTLPSEAEWEKAARGPSGLIYPWGNEPDLSRANYYDTGIHDTNTVGCFPDGASLAYGVEELSGNVWEWTRSILEEYPYSDHSAQLTPHDPLPSDDTKPRVVRGGACYNGPQDVRGAVRNAEDTHFANGYLSFRVVLSVLP